MPKKGSNELGDKPVDLNIDTWNILQAALASGVLCINQVRRMLGMEPIAGGDVHYFSVQGAIVPVAFAEEFFKITLNNLNGASNV